MTKSQVAGLLPRSHSPVLRWIRNPLSLGLGGSNPSLGATTKSNHYDSYYLSKKRIPIANGIRRQHRMKGSNIPVGAIAPGASLPIWLRNDKGINEYPIINTTIIPDIKMLPFPSAIYCHQPFFSDFGGSGGILLRLVNQKVPTEPSANFISTLRSAFTSVILPSLPSNCSNSELRGVNLF